VGRLSRVLHWDHETGEALKRQISAIAIVALAAACSSDRVTESVVEVPLPPEAFAGTWRSVTPSLEFIRLTVESKSSEAGGFGARLTYSGIAWEGSGRIDADSLVVSLTPSGSGGPVSVLVMRAPVDRTLQAQHRISKSDALALSFVRED
jgi:hypothetical protein